MAPFSVDLSKVRDKSKTMVQRMRPHGVSLDK